MTETIEAVSGSPEEECINFDRVKAGSPAAECRQVIEDLIKETSGEYKKDVIYKKLPVHMKLPRQMMSKMFMEVLGYLLESKMISADEAGHICWIYSPEAVKLYEGSDDLKFTCEKDDGCIYFGDKKIVATYNEILSSSSLENQNALKALNDAAAVLGENIFSGNLIPKRIIPKKYNKDFESSNLWRYNVGNSWKIIYRVLSDGEKRIIVIADWINNKDYERLFGEL